VVVLGDADSKSEFGKVGSEGGGREGGRGREIYLRSKGGSEEGKEGGGGVYDLCTATEWSLEGDLEGGRNSARCRDRGMKTKNIESGVEERKKKRYEEMDTTLEKELACKKLRQRRFADNRNTQHFEQGYRKKNNTVTGPSQQDAGG